MRVSRSFAAALCGAMVATTGPAAAQALDPQQEFIFSGVTTNNSARTGYLSYRLALSGSLDDGLFLRGDAMLSRFTYPAGSGTRTVARLALMQAVPVAAGRVDVGAGLSYGREANTPAAPGDFSSFGVFAAVIGEFEPAPGHDLNLVAEYDSPDSQVFLRGYYQVDLGGLAIGPLVHWVNNTNYRRVQYGLRLSYDVAPGSELALSVTTGNEASGGGPSSRVHMFELGLRARF